MYANYVINPRDRLRRVDCTQRGSEEIENKIVLYAHVLAATTNNISRRDQTGGYIGLYRHTTNTVYRLLTPTVNRQHSVDRRLNQ